MTLRMAVRFCKRGRVSGLEECAESEGQEEFSNLGITITCQSSRGYQLKNSNGKGAKEKGKPNAGPSFLESEYADWGKYQVRSACGTSATYLFLKCCGR